MVVSLSYGVFHSMLMQSFVYRGSPPHPPPSPMLLLLQTVLPLLLLLLSLLLLQLLRTITMIYYSMYGTVCATDSHLPSGPKIY